MILSIRGNTEERLERIARRLDIPKENVVKDALESYCTIVEGRAHKKKSWFSSFLNSFILNSK